MSYKQRQQKCPFSVRYSTKYSPDCPPRSPRVPSSCPPAGLPPASGCAPTCCVSLVSYRFPRLYLCQPQHSNCCENVCSGRPGCCHSSGGCN